MGGRALPSVDDAGRSTPESWGIVGRSEAESYWQADAHWLMAHWKSACSNGPGCELAHLE